MLRIARGLADGFIYRVLNRGNGRVGVFHKAHDYEAFIDLKRDRLLFIRI
jgi:putative transposase